MSLDLGFAWQRGLLAAAALCAAAFAVAQAQGGLYIAGDGFSFKVAAERAMSQNRSGQRFFLLSLPPQTAALGLSSATPAQRRLRERVLAANGVLLVCQRDIDNGRVAAASLAPGVVAVRGWPAPGGRQLPPGERYFPDENPAQLPAANEALRQLRSTCA